MNPFKSAIARGEQQIGLWLSLAHAYSAEVCATAGFDWLLVDGEHAPNDIPGTLAQLQALAAYRSHAVVRVVQGDASLVKQMMDIGVQTLLVPMVDTAQQARAMVAATRYPPQGVRGVAASVARASRWGAQADYLDRANDDACLLVQAESATALANLDEICAVDGVDGVFIGPADLAASMGRRGHPGHPEAHRIAAIPGDGIGKEVMPEALRVLDAASRRFGFALELTPIVPGPAATISRSMAR
jgi:4-hydroxy-2-oxoheptanedioate aldolase